MAHNISEEAASAAPTWRPALEAALAAAPGLQPFLDDDYQKHAGELEVFPPAGKVFNAFSHFEIDRLRVVVLGQDVYPTKGDAMGLSFSVPNGTRCAPSLRNILKEVSRSYGKRETTDLTDWARQGVLLLNTALTVREGCPGSHIRAWKPFTAHLLEHIAKTCSNIVYMLWGNHAQEYERLIDPARNLVLRSIHPSPLAARSGSFVGNGHFEKANEYLAKFEGGTISWA